jgi:integrase
MNTNHPAAGSHIKVDPIKNLKDIKAIKKILAATPRDYALFVMGINTNLRASDLINLTVGQVRNLQVGDDIVLVEQKTGKERRITLNNAVVDAIQTHLTSADQDDVDPLFKSRKGGRLTVPSINRLVKGWCAAINLKGNYGSHSLRKTFGYHMRTTFKVDLPTLMTVFNHATQRQTLAYLGVQPSEVRAVYHNEL